MAIKKQVAQAPKTKLSAYAARNRASLIKATQEVLAEVGLNATIEQLANSAQVSQQTIYNYFENKEKLLSEALEGVLRDWFLWAEDGSKPGESFQRMLDIFRLLFREQKINPKFAKILKNTLVDPVFVINAIKTKATQDIRKAAAKEGFAQDQFEKRAYLWSHSLVAILNGIYVTEELSPEQADAHLEISLQVLDISKAKAKKLVSHPLVYPEPSTS